MHNETYKPFNLSQSLIDEMVDRNGRLGRQSAVCPEGLFDLLLVVYCYSLCNKSITININMMFAGSKSLGEKNIRLIRNTFDSWTVVPVPICTVGCGQDVYSSSLWLRRETRAR
jgi:hypothetical protein